jgi:hypothetical protein
VDHLDYTDYHYLCNYILYLQKKKIKKKSSLKKPSSKSTKPASPFKEKQAFSITHHKARGCIQIKNRPKG